jgi:putative PIN family toxin of toxin-antitoxin system
LRAVLDPNVIISGLIAPNGAPARVLSNWRDGRFEVIVSTALLAELERAMVYPKLRRYLSPQDAQAALRWLVDGATRAEDTGMESPVSSADAGDDYLIALAAQESAALVSGDKHLLDLRPTIPVYSPREFLDLIEGR